MRRAHGRNLNVALLNNDFCHSVFEHLHQQPVEQNTNSQYKPVADPDVYHKFLFLFIAVFFGGGAGGLKESGAHPLDQPLSTVRVKYGKKWHVYPEQLLYDF